MERKLCTRFLQIFDVYQTLLLYHDQKIISMLKSDVNRNCFAIYNSRLTSFN